MIHWNFKENPSHSHKEEGILDEEDRKRRKHHLNRIIFENDFMEFLEEWWITLLIILGLLGFILFQCMEGLGSTIK